MNDDAPVDDTGPRNVPGALAGCTILVVEDEFIVAQVLVDILEDAGAKVVGPIGWADEALSLINDNAVSFDRAILDLNLHGRNSYPIADALIVRNVAFVFTTGYGAEAIDQPYRAFPRCQKPFRSNELVAALTAA